MPVQMDRRAFLAAAASTPLLAGIPDVALAAYQTFDLKVDFGAVGDGITDDTAAFQRAATKLMTVPEKGGVLTIPAGTYLVGRQYVPGDPEHQSGGPYYQPADIFSVQGLNLLQINGYGAKVRIKDGLRYGGFDLSGNPVDITNIAQQDPDKIRVAHVGRVFEIQESNSVWIRGIEIDGNNTKLRLGGQWGDVDRQANATGIWLNRCPNASITEAYVHHHGLDGITILYQQEKVATTKQHYIIRTRSEYNGRQALSWIGGNGLDCRDSKFNHTGRAINVGGGVDNGLPLKSAPGAGVDIEPNPGRNEWTRNGVFTGCEFINNAGAGLLANNGDGGYTTFDSCTFWGTTYYSIWPDRPGLKFTNCNIYGTAVHANDGTLYDGSGRDPALATLFDGCTFEDLEWTDGRVFRSSSSPYLYDVGNSAADASWKNCNFNAHKVRSVYAGPTSSATSEYFEACIFMHGHSGLPDLSTQATFRNSRLLGCHFMETTDVSSGSARYYINVYQAQVLTGLATHVDGPKVRWRNPTTGQVGVDIPPGTYSS